MRGLNRHCVAGIDQEDRISNLPRNVIDQILSRLSIRDCARTSVLSKTWRYKWSELPCLVFDMLSFGSPCISFSEFASIVDHVVFFHRGTILRFEYINYRGKGVVENRAMDRWIMHLSKSPIKEFAIRTHLDGYCLPPCFFHWQSLTQLSLVCISTIKLPSTFKGFPNLKSLVLRLESIVENDLEKLIARCPVLESLTLKTTHSLSHFNVVAPSLVFFSVEGDIRSLSFENTSRLADVSIYVYGYSDPKFQVCSNSSNLLKFCAQMPMIRKLRIRSSFLEYLAVAIDPSNLPSANAKLESLTLNMNLNVREDCLGARGILNIFQNLCKLSIEIDFYRNRNEDLTSSDGNIWDDQRLSCPFNNLQLVDIKGHGITGTRRDLEFIEFVLSSSPVLERMVVKANISKDNDDDENRLVVKNLLSFKRASVHAQVIFEDC